MKKIIFASLLTVSLGAHAETLHIKCVATSNSRHTLSLVIDITNKTIYNPYNNQKYSISISEGEFRWVENSTSYYLNRYTGVYSSNSSMVPYNCVTIKERRF